MSITGRYILRDGKVVKVSTRVSSNVSKDRWFAKHKIDGREDMRNAYKSFEEQGKLGAVNDKEVWRDL